MHYNDEFVNDKLENIENSNFDKNEKNDNNCDCAFSTTKQIVMLIINAILIILYFVFNIWEMAVFTPKSSVNIFDIMWKLFSIFLPWAVIYFTAPRTDAGRKVTVSIWSIILLFFCVKDVSALIEGDKYLHMISGTELKTNQIIINLVINVVLCLMVFLSGLGLLYRYKIRINKSNLTEDSEFCQCRGDKIEKECVTQTEMKEETLIVEPLLEDSEKQKNQNIKTPKKKRIKVRFCKYCGGLIDAETKKCSGCGKQYFRGVKITNKLVIGILIVMLITSLCFNVILFKEKEELYLQSKELDNKLMIVSEGLLLPKYVSDSSVESKIKANKKYNALRIANEVMNRQK